MKSKVFIVGHDGLIEQMYQQEGFEITNKIEKADIVQFTGGEDVSPEIYDQVPVKRCGIPDHDRDLFEYEVYKEARGNGQLLVGICRGGQFLHVMNGGTLWQDVNNHGRTHRAKMMTVSGGYIEIDVTSTHHQMMRMDSPEEHELIMWADRLSTYKTAYDKNNDIEWSKVNDPVDVECLIYPNKQTVCFQPHPEYVENGHPCRDYFFNMIHELL